MSFEGRHVVVTGGTGALGVAVVARLLEQGRCVTCPISMPAKWRISHRDDQRVRLRGGVDLTSEDAVDGFYDDVAGLRASVRLGAGMVAYTAAKSAVAAMPDADHARWPGVDDVARQPGHKGRRDPGLRPQLGVRIEISTARGFAP